MEAGSLSETPNNSTNPRRIGWNVPVDDAPSSTSNEKVMKQCNSEDISEQVQNILQTLLNRGVQQLKVENLEILEAKKMPAFKVSIQSLTERRIVWEQSEPYKNQYVDGGQNGPVPDKWEVVANPPSSFMNRHMIVDMPHSAGVSSCPDCFGAGNIMCQDCRGAGELICDRCFGEGKYRLYEDIYECSRCKRTGKLDCCGTGHLKCRKCHGHKQMKYWQSIEVTWKTKIDEFVTPRDELQAKHLGNALGMERLDVVKNVKDSKTSFVWKENSSLEYHGNRFLHILEQQQDEDHRLLRIKQMVREIPVLKVTYLRKDKGKHGWFYIYGLEKRVYFPKMFRKYFTRSRCSIM